MINSIAKHIISRYQINKFVETGVHMADTLMIVQDWFIELYGDEFNTGPWRQGRTGRYNIFEVEINKEYFNQFLLPKVQDHNNIFPINEDSVPWLNKVISQNLFSEEDNCFFYLDAHSHGSSNPEPLRGEISEILKLKKSIISVDDWNVPGKNPDIYSLDHIRDLLIGRTDVVYYSDKHNLHGKWSIFIFLDRYSNDLDVDLAGLPLVKEML